MQKFNSKAELIEAKAQQMNLANLRDDGCSILELERLDAATKVKQTTASYAKFDKIPEPVDCFFIVGFGYCVR